LERQRLREAHGDFDPNNEFWKQVAVTQYVGDIKGALEIHHAVDDDVVSIEYSRNLMNLLDKTQVSHELFEYPTGGHNITGSSYNTAMQRTVEFFKAHLQ
jgi:dipeptidyl aminopeptidase/acylaminoacyl peptidase